MRRSAVPFLLSLVALMALAMPAFTAGPAAGRTGDDPPVIDPNLPVFAWVNGTKAASTSFADLTATFDTNKTYTIYKVNCSEYVAVANDDRTWVCPRRTEEQRAANANCEDCVVFAYWSNGELVGPRSALANTFTNPYALTGIGAAAVGGGYLIARDGSTPDEVVVPFTIAGGTYAGLISLQTPGGSCSGFRDPGDLTLGLNNITDAGLAAVLVRHTLANGQVDFNGTGTLTREGTGFLLTINPTTTGSLTGSGSAVINSTGTSAQLTHNVTNANGTCRYGGTVNK